MMTSDDVIRLAREAGFSTDRSKGWIGTKSPFIENTLERFANLVVADFLQRSGKYVTNDASREAVIAEAVAAEREECAMVCDERAMKNENSAQEAESDDDATGLRAAAWQMSICAATIRARGEKGGK